jgi:hypothetical protein
MVLVVDNHIVAKLFKEKKIANKLFSLCFAAEGGSMAIGAPDTTRHKGKISYAKLVGTSGHKCVAYLAHCCPIRLSNLSHCVACSQLLWRRAAGSADCRYSRGGLDRDAPFWTIHCRQWYDGLVPTELDETSLLGGIQASEWA